MPVTLAESADHLNLTGAALEELSELGLYVSAANEWIASRVTDTSLYTVKLATLFLIEHWWQSQRGPSSVVLDDGSVFVGGRGYAIPNRVKELLGASLIPTAAPPEGSFPDAVAWPDPVEWPPA